MSKDRHICVYCASSSAVDQKFKDIAEQYGAFCAKRGYRIVYGGGHVGLMGILADSALAAGGSVTGVIPQALKDKEVAHNSLSELHVTSTLQERQLKMAELSDSFVVLPGGLGTLAEFFEIVTWKQLFWHEKPIAVLNAYGYWDSMLKMLQEAHAHKFLRQRPDELFNVFDSIDALKDGF